jgi:hypothetical protein
MKNPGARFWTFLRSILGAKRGGETAHETWKSIPYGVGSFELLRQENYYYVDKTGYLREIKKAPPYLFIIRPRRFGKTLLLAMMETYFDIDKAGQFEYYFKGTDIYENPTAERNSYLILKFDFSEIDVSEPSVKEVEGSFFYQVKDTVALFISKYHKRLKVGEKETINDLMTRKSPSDLLSSLLKLCRKATQKVYLFIDEYDNFANTILSTAGRSSYEDLTHGKGFFKTFFKVIKAGTSGTDVPIKRLFITGVSPITMDDVTSGFNIGENISIDKAFNEMMGFRQQEVVEMIEYYRKAGEIRHESGYLLDVMSRWYNHYRFSKESNNEVFNPTLVLHFFKEYFKNHKIPDELFDDNVKTDYEKLRHLVLIDKRGIKETNGNFSKLKAVIEDGFVKSEIKKGFPLKLLERHENFYSLLFYFGLLTIQGVEKGNKLKLAIPNEAIKKLFYEYLREAYDETGVLKLDRDKYSEKMERMVYNGEWNPLFDYIAQQMEESMGLRDLITGEKFIQGFWHAYLGWSDYYIVHSEKELNKGYADLVLEPFLAKYEGITFSYLIEIKYMKSGESKDQKKVAQLKAEAGEQLKQYSMDEKFRKNIGKTTLIKLVLVFSGHKLAYIGEAKE